VVETPAEEWARALAELEPLRLEFEVIGADALWRYARAISAIVLVTALALTIPALREREPLLLLPMLLITALLACIPGWYVLRALRLGPESVELDGTRMIIRRRLGSRGHVSEFDEYDQAVRERLGMRLQPNVCTHDAARAAVDLVEGWDSMVPGRFRLF
jgi:hypothetical protein